MNITRECLTSIIENCYRKFKNLVLFSSYREFQRERIAVFESDKEKMNFLIDSLSNALLLEDKSYFDVLLNQISIRIYTKSIIETEEEGHLITNECAIKEKIEIEKVNFFIDMPIELFILDIFWSLVFGEVLYNKQNESDLCYANKFSSTLFSDDQINAIDRINFGSLDVFKPYYSQYINWKNSAIYAAKALYNDGKDSSIVSLDFSRYYYTANIDFDLIEKYALELDDNFHEFDFLTSVLSNIYTSYSKRLSRFDFTIKKSQTTIPIGLVSACILSNFYLRDFDQRIKATDGVKYYGRYVDDVLLVVDTVEFNDFGSLVKSKFSSIFEAHDHNSFSVKNHFNTNIQQDKTKIFKIKKNCGSNILNNLLCEIHPSEPKLFPSYKIDFKEFINDISEKPDSLRIRDASDSQLNIKKLISAINGYIFLNINTFSSLKPKKSDKDKIDDEELRNFFNLLTPSILLKLDTRWNKIFLFAALQKNAKSIEKELVTNINKSIKYLSCNTMVDTDFNVSLISRFIRRDIRKLLFIAQAMSRGIIGVRKKNHDKIDQLSIKIRHANMVDFNPVATPLLNYVKDLPDNIDLYTARIGDPKVLSLLSNGLEFEKIKYSPRFLHVHEYMYYRQILALQSVPYSVDFDSIFKEYNEIFVPIFGTETEGIKISRTLSESKKYCRFDFDIKDYYSSDEAFENGVYVGMANVDLSKIPTKKGGKLIFARMNNIHKSNLIKLLNDGVMDKVSYYWAVKKVDGKILLKKTRKSKRKAVSFLGFPETYLPISWIPLISKYSRDTGVVVVSGLKYVKMGSRVLNLQVVSLPYRDKHGHKESLIFIREKNDYAPAEKEIIVNTKLTFIEHKSPIYYCFKHRDIKFTSFICYELTDVLARAIMRHQAEIIFASEYNYDIAYFSNIAESTSRDLYSYVVQINSSECGDTRIVAPFRDKYKTIAGISGGEKDSIHIGQIDLSTHRDYLREFKLHEVDCKYESLQNKDKYKKFKKPSAGE